MTVVNIAVEGDSDVELAKQVVRAAGHIPGTVRPARGTGRLDPKIAKYHAASRWQPWVVLRDTDGERPVRLRERLLAGTASLDGLLPTFRLRFARTMSEAWLLADSSGFAEYFRVRPGQVPQDPESLPHAKRTLLDLCAGSRSATIRDEVVSEGPRPGPLYVYHLNSFAADRWDIDAALYRSDSLRRAVERIRTISDTPT